MAPGAYYVTSGNFDGTALVLWLLNSLFFGSSAFYVHTRIRALALRKAKWGWKDRLTYGGINVAYHFVMIGILVLLAFNRITPTLQLLALRSQPFLLNSAKNCRQSQLASPIDLSLLSRSQRQASLMLQ